MTETQPKLQTTPIKPKRSIVGYVYELPDLKERRRQLAVEMLAYFIGFPSVKDFMAWLMDIPTDVLSSPDRVRFTYKPGTREDEMYEPLVSVVFTVGVAFVCFED